jgi:hypothetical protein
VYYALRFAILEKDTESHMFIIDRTIQIDALVKLLQTISATRFRLDGPELKLFENYVFFNGIK